MPSASATQSSSSAATEANTQPCDTQISTAGLLPLDTSYSTSLKNKVLKQLHLSLYRSGLSSLYGKLKRDSTAAIVMYHSIPAPHEVEWVDPCNCLSAEKFEEQIRYLAQHRNVISIEQLTQKLEASEPIEEGTVAITFDDGYLNNLTVAAPILAKYNVPATLYLATDYIEKGANQWIDTIYSTFRARSKEQLNLPALAAKATADNPAGPAKQSWDLSDPTECIEAYREVTGYLIEASVEQKQALLAELDTQLAPTTYPPRLTMTWDDVRDMQKNYPNITLGIHTANHVDLSTHTVQTTQEITTAVEQVTRETGTRPEHLAFPYNRYNDEALAQVEAANLRSAVAEGEDPVVRVGTSRYSLPRIEGPQTLTMLKSWTNGGFPDLSRRLFKRVWTRPY
ncbi:MAG: polysaccharide deacetylase family protein [Cyanobacteria bacterium P01_F01_bin.53]